MTGPTNPNKCRRHGYVLTPEGICTACQWEDKLHLYAEFAEVIAPLRAEGGVFGPMPPVQGRRLRRIGDLSGYPTLDGGWLDRRPKGEQ